MAFQLKSDKKETENKTVRFPVPLIEQINKALIGNDVTFSGFVIQACEYALKNMDRGYYFQEEKFSVNKFKNNKN